MFKQIKEWAEEKQELRTRRELERDERLRELFERDPIADQTKWSPLVSGGANFKTRELVQTQPDRLSFKATGSSKLFTAFFVGLSLVTVLGGLAVEEGSILLIIGSIFLIASIFLFRHSTQPIVFDQTLGLHWKGTLHPRDSAESASGATRFFDIHAIQIISELVRSSSSSSTSSRSRRETRYYYSYELNLVLKDGSRVNVIDHGDRQAVRADAAQVGAFIGVPVWDAT